MAEDNQGLKAKQQWVLIILEFAGSLQQRSPGLEPRLLLEVHEAGRRRRGNINVQEWKNYTPGVVIKACTCTMTGFSAAYPNSEHMYTRLEGYLICANI